MLTGPTRLPKGKRVNTAWIKQFCAVFFLCLLGMPVWALERQKASVAQVLSGDSVRLGGAGKILRYIGVQSPPLEHPVPLVRQYGKDAFEFNRHLVEGKTIWIEWGGQLREERTNNLLGYVFLEEGTFVNKEILAAGHGKAINKAPNLKHAALFRQADLKARRDRLGLWKAEPENPFIRHAYIGEKNTRVYYFPTSPELERIPQANLETFNSRVEAKAAGYRPCFNCSESEEALY